MSSKDLFEKEYSSLRAEIDRNSHIVTTVFLANITVTAALIGYGLGLDKIIGAIFLSPFAIIIPALFFLSSQLESTTRIAAYIKVFFEDNSDELKWETRWLCLREKDLLPAKRKYTFAISHLYGGLSIVCFLLAGFNWNWECKWHLFVISAVPISVLLVIGTIYLTRTFGVKFCQDYIDAWKRLKYNRYP